MKKLLLTIPLFLIVFLLNAQINPGTIEIGASVNFITSNQNYSLDDGSQAPGEIKSTSYSVIPAIGTFLTNNVSVGIKIGMTGTNDLNNFNHNLLDTKTTIFTIGAFARYYKMLNTQASFFIQGDGTLGSGKHTYTRNNNGYPQEIKDISKSLQAGLRPGFVYFITSKIGLESTFGFLGYNKRKQTNDGNNLELENTTNNFILSLNSSTLNMGLRFYLSR